MKMSLYVRVVKILPERLQTAEIGGGKGGVKKKIIIWIWFCFSSLSPITLATLQSLWTANLVFTALKRGSHRTTRGLGFFSFREYTWEPRVLALLNCSKLSYILHQKSSQSHNNYRLKHTSYPKAVIKL